MKPDVCEKVAYIIRQFKRREETDLMRSVYEKLFFQVSIYSHRPSRVDGLSQMFASSSLSSSPNLFREQAERLVRIDEDEAENENGQRVGDVFHDADVIVSTDHNEIPTEDQVKRFVDLLFGSNTLSPTKQEYGMYVAKSASLRSLDLSRQVGAAIFTSNGEIISIGTNEVPKAGGGTYWSDDEYDARDYTKGQDGNQKRKTEILQELFQLVMPANEASEAIQRKEVLNSRFMDALEYGRMIHAEMSAICDAARKGLALKGHYLFCTTFPCHMCAKHIVAAGIDRVVFLEPYPKSLANDLNGDSLDIEGQYRGEYAKFPGVKFCHFFGISPRRYRDFYEGKRRKDATGNVIAWKSGAPKPIVDIFVPNYIQNEVSLNRLTSTSLLRLGVDPIRIFNKVAVPFTPDGATSTGSTDATLGT